LTSIDSYPNGYDPHSWSISKRKKTIKSMFGICFESLNHNKEQIRPKKS
jgi:hypothetical protein